MSYKRTAEDAIEVVRHAKHKPEEVHSISQVFYYPSAEDCEDTKKNMRLMDVDETFIERLEQGERFVFRGTGDEKLVLCTENESFDVKEGEISNALVFVPQLSYLSDVKTHSSSSHQISEKKISGILHSYLELRPTFPKLRKLHQVLRDAVYNGPDEEEENENGGYFLCDLLEIIQSSRAELLNGLRDIKACCIEGRWRLLSVEYETRVLSHMINLCEEKHWAEIPRSGCCLLLRPFFPDFVVDHIFDHFTVPCQENDDDIRKWEAKNVCRSFGEMLLRAGGGKFRYNDFMTAWHQCLPKGVEPDLTSLRGLALMEEEGTQKHVIHLFPEHDLPENITERFRLLFKRKAKWTLQQIQPYIEKLASKGMNVSTMLTKFSRPSTEKGVRVFGSRY